MAINVIFNQFDYEISERKKEIWDKYNKIIQWGRKHPLRFAENFLGVQFTDHQKYIFMSTWTAKFIVWLMGRNSGKATTLDTPIYYVTKNNDIISKIIGDLKIGDKILDDKGNPTEVIHLNPIIFEEVYEVEFEDHEIIECNREHLWMVCDLQKDEPKWQIRETGELYHLISNKTQNSFLLIPSFNNVNGKNILIVDDMISSGGSVIDICEQLSKKGAKKVNVITTFAFFTEGLEKFNKMYESGVLNKVYATNASYIADDIKKAPWFIEVDICVLLGHIIDTLNKNESLSPIINSEQKLQELLLEYNFKI